jgi:hypothetical protein
MMMARICFREDEAEDGIAILKKRARAAGKTFHQGEGQ